MYVYETFVENGEAGASNQGRSSFANSFISATGPEIVEMRPTKSALQECNQLLLYGGLATSKRKKINRAD